jgi:steroid delta-isomerase-like uncharacterized protein
MGAGKDLWTEFVMLYNKGDLAGALSLFAPDAVVTDPTGRYEGHRALQAYAEEAHKPFSDLKMELSRLIEDGDTVAAEYRWRATQTGPIAMPDGTEIPATGKAMDLPGVSILTVRSGKFVDRRDYFDNMSMMNQLRVMRDS